MSRLPDRFDLWLRKARECPDPARQVDYILGALLGLDQWWLINLGTPENPQAARTEMEGELCVLVFSDAGRLEEFLESKAGRSEEAKLSATISMPSAGALKWCVEGGVGLILNLGEEEGAVFVPFAQLKAFLEEWTQRGGRQAAGFWIPNMTTEEEDFWQENGV